MNLSSIATVDISDVLVPLLGEVSACSGFVGDKNRRFLEISFYTQDAAKSVVDRISVDRY